MENAARLNISLKLNLIDFELVITFVVFAIPANKMATIAPTYKWLNIT